jgi:hypothetical protein
LTETVNNPPIDKQGFIPDKPKNEGFLPDSVQHALGLDQEPVDKGIGGNLVQNLYNEALPPKPVSAPIKSPVMAEPGIPDATVGDLGQVLPIASGLGGAVKELAGEVLPSLAKKAAVTEATGFLPDIMAQPGLPGIPPTATSATVNKFASTAVPGEVLDLGGGPQIKYGGVQQGFGFVPDQPQFDIKGTNLPPELTPRDLTGPGSQQAQTVVGTPNLAEKGLLAPDNPVTLYPATKTPTGYKAGHEWGPIFKQINATEDPVEKASIINEGKNKVGYIDDAGKFYTAEDYSNLLNQGKIAKPLGPIPRGKGNLTPINAPPSTGGTPITLSNQDLSDINKATGTNLQPQLEQQELPRTAVKNPPVPPVPTDPIVKGFGDEINKGFIRDDYAPGYTTMSRRFALIAQTEPTSYAGALPQVENKVIQAEIRMGQQYNNYLRTLDKYGIEPGSKESDVLFDYLSGNKSADELVQQYGTRTASKMIDQAGWMRKEFDQTLEMINSLRAQRGLPPITRRANFVNQMDQINSVGDDIISAIKGNEDLDEKAATTISQADKYRVAEPDIAFKHVIRRTGDEHAKDAITSFKRYMYDALNYKELQPEVQRINQMADIARQNSLPNLAKRLDEYAGYVAGKPQLMDQLAVDMIGRQSFDIIQRLSRNTQFSIISFNPAIWASQTLRLLPKIMLEGIGLDNLKAFAKMFDSTVSQQVWDNVPFLQKMFLNSEEAALTGGYGGAGIMQKSEKFFADIPRLIDGFLAKHTAILAHDAKLAELTAKYPMSAASDLDKQAWLYAEHSIEKYQALIAKGAVAPYFRAKSAKMLTPLAQEAATATNFIYHDVLRNTGDLNRATQVARGMAGLSAVAIMGSLMQAVGGTEQRPLLGKALFPFLKVVEAPLAMVKTVVAPVAAAKSYLEGQGTGKEVIKASIKSYILARGTPGGLQVVKFIDSLFGK